MISGYQWKNNLGYYQSTKDASTNFYKSVFGGEFPYLGRFGDIPTSDGEPPVEEADKNKIMHVSLPI